MVKQLWKSSFLYGTHNNETRFQNLINKRRLFNLWISCLLKNIHDDDLVGFSSAEIIILKSSIIIKSVYSYLDYYVQIFTDTTHYFEGLLSLDVIKQNSVFIYFYVIWTRFSNYPKEQYLLTWGCKPKEPNEFNVPILLFKINLYSILRNSEPCQ